MPKKATRKSISSTGDSDVQLLAWLATCVSVFSFLFYYRYGQVMLYGDAVAHINIARRVFDSKTPGLLQLGTVWLPLPHLLMMPFLIFDEMWRRGVGGSIPSMVAYVFGVVGIFRLIRGVFSDKDHAAFARIAAWAGAIAYAANPNLIYMQATAMGESPYLALFIWSVVFFSEFRRGDARALNRCGLCLFAACLTRYDAWFLAAAMATTVVLLHLFVPTTSVLAPSAGPGKPLHSRLAVVKFLLLAASAPVFWLAYNGIVYRNPLEFENGPYSAKAIEKRTQNPSNPAHPGSGNLLVAGLYFAKAGESNMAENPWLGRIWVALALCAAVAAARLQRRDRNSNHAALPLLFLLTPLPFYALSVAYGGVPIFVPAFWPFTHYNVRYGLQLLPALAAAVGVLVFFVMHLAVTHLAARRFRLALMLGICGVVVISYASVWRAAPICLNEAVINMRNRNQLEARLASWLQTLPPDSTLLMYLGDHVGALQRAGIPLRRVINEGNHRVWMQPEDPDGLWERALANPTQYADYAVAFEEDRVWQVVHNLHLKALVEIHVTGQAPAILYRMR